MSDNQDIRAWARDNGWDVSDKGRLAAEVREAYEARNGHDEGEGEPFVILPDPPGPAASAVPAAESFSQAKATGDGERPPAPVAQQRRGLFQRQPKPPGKPGTKPKARPRVSIENILGTAYGLGAMALARKPEAIPVARVLDMQAPVAGIIGDELLRGTIIDKFLQPLARAGVKGEMAVAMVGPPLLVGAVTARPEIYPVIRPVLKLTMMTWLEIAEPAMIKVQQRESDWAEKFGHIDLDGMIDGIFAGLPDSGPVSEQEEEHVRRARGDDS